MVGYIPGEQPRQGGYIKLNTNENPYPPSPRVGKALSVESERLRLYPDPIATRLRSRIAELHNISPENVLVGNGSDDILTIVIRTFAGEGDLVVSPSPTYTLYTTLCEIQGANYVAVPYNDDYSLNEGDIPEGAHLVFICNPNSPSGTVLSEESLGRIALRISGALLVDEAYVDFSVWDCVGLLKKHKNVIIARSLSKSFSLAGLRVGYALADKGIIDNLAKVKDSYNVNRMAIAGGLAALNDMQWMKINRQKIIATRLFLTQALEEMGFCVYPSQANFVLAKSETCPANRIYAGLKRKSILVRYYDTPRLKDCLRISVGTDEEIEKLLLQIAEIMDLKK